MTIAAARGSQVEHQCMGMFVHHRQPAAACLQRPVGDTPALVPPAPPAQVLQQLIVAAHQAPITVGMRVQPRLHRKGAGRHAATCPCRDPLTSLGRRPYLCLRRLFALITTNMWSGMPKHVPEGPQRSHVCAAARLSRTHRTGSTGR